MWNSTGVAETTFDIKYMIMCDEDMLAFPALFASILILKKKKVYFLLNFSAGGGKRVEDRSTRIIHFARGVQRQL